MLSVSTAAATTTAAAASAIAAYPAAPMLSKSQAVVFICYLS